MEDFSHFFMTDYEGQCVDLQPIKRQRYQISLAGLSSLLIAIGGWNRLKVCRWLEINGLSFLISTLPVTNKGAFYSKQYEHSPILVKRASS